MSERVIGIDLGTTNSCVATVEGGVPKVIANKGGYKTTPSMVAISESGRRLVGHIAKRQAITNAANTVYAAKRLIGRKWSHPTVQRARQVLPYKLVEGETGDVRIELRDKTYYWHTGAIGGIKSIGLQKMLAEHPERAIEFAVKGMLPKNPLGRAMFKKLHVFEGANHPHTAQQPKPLDL